LGGTNLAFGVGGSIAVVVAIFGIVASRTSLKVICSPETGSL